MARVEQEMEAQRRRAWLNIYLQNGRRGKDAALEVGVAEKNASRQANRWLKHPECVAEIARIDALAVKKSELTIEGMLREIHAIVHMNIAECFMPDGSLKPIKDWPENAQRACAGFEVAEEVIEQNGPEGPGTIVGRAVLKKVKFWDKNAAIDKGMRHFPGGYAATKVEVKDVTNHGDMLNEARARRAAALAARDKAIAQSAGEPLAIEAPKK